MGKSQQHIPTKIHLICQGQPISMKKAQVLSLRPLSVSDQQTSSSWHTVCSGGTSGDILPLLWFTTLNCDHLISAYSLRHKMVLAFADKATRRAAPHCRKAGQDVRIERGPPLQAYLNTPNTTGRKKRSDESADEAASRASGDMKGRSVTQGLWLENVDRLKQRESACNSWQAWYNVLFVFWNNFTWGNYISNMKSPRLNDKILNLSLSHTFSYLMALLAGQHCQYLPKLGAYYLVNDVDFC